MSVIINERELFWNELIPQLENKGIKLNVDNKSKDMKYLYGSVDKNYINNDNIEIIIDLNSKDDYYKDNFNDGIPVIWVMFKGNNKVEDRDNFFNSLINKQYSISINREDEADNYSKLMIRRSNKKYKLYLEEEAIMVKEILIKILRILNEDNN